MSVMTRRAIKAYAEALGSIEELAHSVQLTLTFHEDSGFTVHDVDGEVLGKTGSIKDLCSYVKGYADARAVLDG
jgi:hypothetical protein